MIAGANLAFGIVVARLLDTLPEDRKFVIVFLAGGFLGMLDMLCFGFCVEKYSDSPRRLHIGRVLKNIRENLDYMFSFESYLVPKEIG